MRGAVVLNVAVGRFAIFIQGSLNISLGEQQRCLLLLSRPGEFHPEPLTEPYVNLSIHTARATARRLAQRRGDRVTS